MDFNASDMGVWGLLKLGLFTGIVFVFVRMVFFPNRE